ncbi:uncharacterized protein MELLADRAFT_84518 [Melampsora larici-populina 98AG31]|uniref:Uncharacterized protein n=1 Tax=Melampsora larici-populina (strain 98AG31 / pathotype 3-4-7) TaxID=747676 RepID=F4SCB1_MELLP|nr:uncharacterized protein MELLADRAFT_84518 [Melampsora larici-populina 98AG31]EGF97719.1 hypothetical protein MELLADRAFT_84518 [Melampsora larici-populina 98AG31]
MINSYDFNRLDQMTEDKSAVFVMDIYGNGEPTLSVKHLSYLSARMPMIYVTGSYKLPEPTQAPNLLKIFLIHTKPTESS